MSNNTKNLVFLLVVGVVSVFGSVFSMTYSRFDFSSWDNYFVWVLAIVLFILWFLFIFLVVTIVNGYVHDYKQYKKNLKGLDERNDILREEMKKLDSGLGYNTKRSIAKTNIMIREIEELVKDFNERIEYRIKSIDEFKEEIDLLNAQLERIRIVKDE
jgi:cell division protein FtsB